MDMKKFILNNIYGENFESCAEARASKWNKLKKKSTLRLPPDRNGKYRPVRYTKPALPENFYTNIIEYESSDSDSDYGESSGEED